MNSKNKKIVHEKFELTEEDFDPRNIKERITIFVDQDVLDEYRLRAKKTGDKYQSLINRTLREALDKSDLEKRIEALERKIKK